MEGEEAVRRKRAGDAVEGEEAVRRKRAGDTVEGEEAVRRKRAGDAMEGEEKEVRRRKAGDAVEGSRKRYQVQGGSTDKKNMKKWWNNKRLRRCLSVEIGVEYKACLYFFVILFFYSMYLFIHGIYEASLLHMLEMIVTAYGMGYLQVLVLDNFDEAERLRGKELLYLLLCAALYTGISFLCGWFDGSIVVTAVFAVYCILIYMCAFLANRVKRCIDTEQLNVMLQEYKRRGRKDDECD